METARWGLRLVLGMVTLLLISCSSPPPPAVEGTGAAPEEPGASAGTPASETGLLQPTAGPATAPETVTASQPAGAGPAAPPAALPAAGGWTRVAVIDARKTLEGEKATVTVRARAPGAGWKLELRRLAGEAKDFIELEAVGQAPARAAPGTPAEETLVTTLDLAGEKPGEAKDRPVLVYGAGGAIFPE